MHIRSLGQEDPLEKEMATTPVFLLKKYHGQRSLVAYSPGGCKELNTTEQLSTHWKQKETEIEINYGLPESPNKKPLQKGEFGYLSWVPYKELDWLFTHKSSLSVCTEICTIAAFLI